MMFSEHWAHQSPADIYDKAGQEDGYKYGGSEKEEDGGADAVVACAWSDDASDDGDLYSRFKEQTTLAVRAELLKAEQALLDAAAKAEDAEEDALAGPSHDGAADESSAALDEESLVDAEEAAFFAAYRMEQRREHEQQERKERNFVKEWAAPFVHLRVTGHAITPPEGVAAEGRPVEFVPSAEDPIASGSTQHSDDVGPLEVIGRACASLRGSSSGEIVSEESHGAEEECIAWHGTGGQEFLALDFQPSLRVGTADEYTRTLLQLCRDELKSRRARENHSQDVKYADPAHVLTREAVDHLVQRIWSGALDGLEKPLSCLVKNETDKRCPHTLRPVHRRHDGATEGCARVVTSCSTHPSQNACVVGGGPLSIPHPPPDQHVEHKPEPMAMSPIPPSPLTSGSSAVGQERSRGWDRRAH